MKGFGTPIHRTHPHPVRRYWLNCCFEDGREEWYSITFRDWKNADRNEGESRFRAVQLFSRLDPCPESAYLFPPSTDPENPRFRDVLDHFQATPFEAMGESSKRIDVEALEERMAQVLTRARKGR